MNGRPYQAHIAAAEIKAISVTGQALFLSSDDNLRKLTELNPDIDHIRKITVGGCFDGGSPYQGNLDGVKGLRMKENEAYRGKHDRMHQHNLVFKDFLSSEQFKSYGRVIEDYRAILSYFGQSTKKLRKLKFQVVELDVFKELESTEDLYIKELKKLANNDIEVMHYLDIVNRQEELEIELQLEKGQIEQSIFGDPNLKNIKELSAKLEEAMVVLNVKQAKLEKLAKEKAEQRIRAHKLTRILEIRMVYGKHKSLKMFERRYVALCQFFEKEVENRESGALLM